MIPRTRDTARGYGSRQRAPAFLADEGNGGWHYSSGMNTQLCLRCGCNRPTKGGNFRGGLFACALHQKASVPA